MWRQWMVWKAFFHPVVGWKERFLQHRSGRNTWPVPGKPEKPKVIPFPIEWIPHTVDEKQLDESDQARGFKFLDVTCCDSGKAAPVGVGVSCLRCGVPLHPSAAGMYSDFDPPVCHRCSWVLILYR